MSWEPRPEQTLCRLTGEEQARLRSILALKPLRKTAREAGLGVNTLQSVAYGGDARPDTIARARSAIGNG